VPGQVVEKLLRAERADPRPERRAVDAEPELFQQIQRLLEALAELLGLLRRRGGASLPGRRLKEPGGQRGVGALGLDALPAPPRNRRQHDERDLDPANRLLLVRMEVADRDRRADPDRKSTRLNSSHVSI